MTEQTKESGPSWLPYVLPMGLFMALTYAEGYLPKAQYPLVYAVKALIVTAALIWASRAWRGEITFDAKAVALGMAAGVIGVVGWVGLNEYIPYPKLGSREALNPFESIDPAWRTLFLAVRFYGLVVMVPIMEEVFWRSWMLRYVTTLDSWRSFVKVMGMGLPPKIAGVVIIGLLLWKFPLGELALVPFAMLAAGLWNDDGKKNWADLSLNSFSWDALIVVATIFAAVHPEWLVAFLFAALMAGLLRYTKSLTACIVAHAVTNLALGIYVLQTGDWKYW